MDSRSVNYNNRKRNGFFLTASKPDDKDGGGEHVVYDGTVKMIFEKLKESKIRASNVLDNLENLETIAQQVEDKVRDLCDANNVSEEGLKAFVWLVVVACVSAYHERIQRVYYEKND